MSGVLGSCLLGAEVGLEVCEVADRSLALTSQLTIFMGFSTSHFSSVSAINCICDGNFFIRIEVCRPPYVLAVIPSAPCTCASTES